MERRNGSMGLSDGKNLNRVFPGNPKGTEMEQLTPYVYYAGKAAEEVVAVSRQMAEQVDVPYMEWMLVSF